MGGSRGDDDGVEIVVEVIIYISVVVFISDFTFSCVSLWTLVLCPFLIILFVM